MSTGEALSVPYAVWAQTSECLANYDDPMKITASRFKRERLSCGHTHHEDLMQFIRIIRMIYLGIIKKVKFFMAVDHMSKSRFMSMHTKFTTSPFFSYVYYVWTFSLLGILTRKDLIPSLLSEQNTLITEIGIAPFCRFQHPLPEEPLTFTLVTTEARFLLLIITFCAARFPLVRTEQLIRINHQSQYLILLKFSLCQNFPKVKRLYHLLIRLKKWYWKYCYDWRIARCFESSDSGSSNFSLGYLSFRPTP